MIKILNSKIQKFEHIIHVSDIHIKLTKYHDEYRDIFLKFYTDVKNSPNNTLVAILGDLFHNKSDLSPECIQLALEFLKTIADIRPVILIAGNHDATLANKNRLDSISPITDALQHPNLFYLKHTGLYGCGNILFNNMSVFDDADKYIKGKNIPSLYRNQYEYIIALYHGSVTGAVTDVGYVCNNPYITPELFDNHDIVLLGDIHKAQNVILNTERSIPESELINYDMNVWEVIEEPLSQKDIG